jgi:putative transcriptional regulator
MSKIGKEILQGLGEFVESLEKNEKLGDRFTCRQIELNLQPETYSPAMVKKTRAKLGLSQSLFAQFLGISRKTVSAWEQGINTPNDMACRFMDEIRRNPKYWIERFRESARAKALT